MGAARPRTSSAGSSTESASAPRMAGQYPHYSSWTQKHPLQEGQTQQQHDLAFLQAREARLGRSVSKMEELASRFGNSYESSGNGLTAAERAYFTDTERAYFLDKLQRKKAQLERVRKSQALYTPGAVSQPAASTSASQPAQTPSA